MPTNVLLPFPGGGGGGGEISGIGAATEIAWFTAPHVIASEPAFAWDPVGKALAIGKASTTTGKLTVFNAGSAFGFSLAPGVGTQEQSYTLPTAMPTINWAGLTSGTGGSMAWTTEPAVSGAGTQYEVAWFNSASVITSHSGMRYYPTGASGATGQLALGTAAFSTLGHDFAIQKDVNDAIGNDIENLNAGAFAYAEFEAQNGARPTNHNVVMRMYGLGWTPQEDAQFQDSGHLASNHGVGGLSISSTYDIRMYAGGQSADDQIITLKTTNLVGIGTANPDAQLHVAGGNWGGSFVLERVSSNAFEEPNFQFRKAYGSVTAPSAIPIDAEQGAITWFGFNDDWRAGARISAWTSTGWGATGTDAPTDLWFATSPDGSATPINHQVITSTGKIGLGAIPSATPTAAQAAQVLDTLHVFGQIRTGSASGTTTPVTGALKYANASSTKITSFQAGVATNDAAYIWPLDVPSVAGSVLASATGGTMSWTAGPPALGTGGDGQVTYWTGTNTISGDGGFQYNKSSTDPVVQVVSVSSTATFQTAIAGGSFVKLKTDPYIEIYRALAAGLDPPPAATWFIRPQSATTGIQLDDGTNIPMRLAAGSTGGVTFALGGITSGTGSSKTGGLTLYHASSAFPTTLQASATTAASVTYSLPVNAPGANDYALTSKTTGVMAWTDFSALYVPLTRTLTAGTGLTGTGDLSADRTFAVANTAVTPASYTNASITVDQQGRLTAASSGTAATTTWLSTKLATLATGSAITTSQLGYLYDDFDHLNADATLANTEYFKSLAVSGAVAVDTATRGGVISLTTGAVGSSNVQLIRGSSAAYTRLVNSGASKFGFAARLKFSTAIDNVTTCRVGLDDGAAATDVAAFGIVGSQSTTKFLFRCNSTGGGGAFNLTSTVSIDTGWHDFVVFQNGTTTSFSVDGETAVTGGPATFAALTNPMLQANNGATAAARTMLVDKILYVFEQAQ